jgi:hypothetical protein
MSPPTDLRPGQTRPLGFSVPDQLVLIPATGWRAARHNLFRLQAQHVGISRITYRRSLLHRVSMTGVVPVDTASSASRSRNASAARARSKRRRSEALHRNVRSWACQRHQFPGRRIQKAPKSARNPRLLKKNPTIRPAQQKTGPDLPIEFSHVH